MHHRDDTPRTPEKTDSQEPSVANWSPAHSVKPATEQSAQQFRNMRKSSLLADCKQDRFRFVTEHLELQEALKAERDKLAKATRWLRTKRYAAQVVVPDSKEVSEIRRCAVWTSCENLNCSR